MATAMATAAIASRIILFIYLLDILLPLFGCLLLQCYNVQMQNARQLNDLCVSMCVFASSSILLLLFCWLAFRNPESFQPIHIFRYSRLLWVLPLSSFVDGVVVHFEGFFFFFIFSRFLLKKKFLVFFSLQFAVCSGFI